jgi:hypothetical protein
VYCLVSTSPEKSVDLSPFIRYDISRIKMKANDVLTSSETATDEAIALGIDISKTVAKKPLLLSWSALLLMSCVALATPSTASILPLLLSSNFADSQTNSFINRVLSANGLSNVIPTSSRNLLWLQ